jgi:hypothetical protein
MADHDFVRQFNNWTAAAVAAAVVAVVSFVVV